MILKDFININLIGLVEFKYKDIIYRSSIPIVEDFIDDNMEFLLNKKVNSISTKVVEYDVVLIIELID